MANYTIVIVTKYKLYGRGNIDLNFFLTGQT